MRFHRLSPEYGRLERSLVLLSHVTFVVYPAICQLKLGDGDNHEHNEKQPSQGAGIPHLEVEKAMMVDVHDPEEQRVHWAGAGHCIITAQQQYWCEDLETADNAKGKHKEDGWRNHRDRDVPEAAYCT